jgi:hypothetical protein
MTKPLLLIGSRAAQFHHPLSHRNMGIDHDLVGYYDDLIDYFRFVGKPKSLVPISGGKKLVAKYADGRIYEAEIAWPESSAEDLYLTGIQNSQELGTTSGKHIIMLPNYDFLYTLKMTHRYLKNSPHFQKTRKDILAMRANLGFTDIPSHLKPFFERREKATYNYGHPKLNVDKAQFFNSDGVDYKYDHDSIHLSVKRMFRPAYEWFKDDEAQVFCSKDKFWACDESIRLNAVLEESMVLAIERSQVPFPGLKTPMESFEMALQKVCTSITSGWFREYAWENYNKVTQLYDDNYVAQFWEDMRSGLVTPYVGEPVAA